MGGLMDWLKSKAEEDGFELDPDELARLGLSDAGDHAPGPDGDILSIALPGEAAGAAEIFLSSEAIGLDKPVESEDGLMWEPIIREGQWAVRPGGKTGKRRVPLKVVAGKSKNQRKEIGLQDIVDAFDDDAIEYVTVPTSHNNHVLENTGFIKGLKIVDGTVKPKKKDAGKEPQKVKVLLGGYDIRKPTVKEGLLDGSIASRSAGILYDYVNTETGKTYPVALEHVALTNKPWITGMMEFGRKVKAKAASAFEIVGLSLSNEQPDDEDFLAQDSSLDGIELSQDGDGEELSWSKEESPNWLRQQVQQQLQEARAKKLEAQRKSQPNGSALYVDYERPPYYRCVEAKPGMALISDDYSDDANFWSAPFEVKDGVVVLADFDKWESLKKDYVPDERPAPSKDKLPLAEEQPKTSDATETLSRRELAIRARKSRAQGEPTPVGAAAADANETRNPPRGGEHMDENERLRLSDEARQAIEAAEARAAAAEQRAEKLSQTVERLAGTVQTSETDGRIARLRSEGFTEEAGFGGLLAYARQVYLADDGEPALQSESFSDDNNKTGELTLSQVVDGFFSAFKRGEDGKVALGEQLAQPPEKKDDDAERKDGEKLSDGKPAPEDPSGKDNRPFEELSREEQDAILAKELEGTALADQFKVPASSGQNGGDA